MRGFRCPRRDSRGPLLCSSAMHLKSIAADVNSWAKARLSRLKQLGEFDMRNGVWARGSEGADENTLSRRELLSQMAGLCAGLMVPAGGLAAQTRAPRGQRRAQPKQPAPPPPTSSTISAEDD